MAARRIFVFSWLMPLMLLAIISFLQPVASDCCPSKALSFQMIDENDDCDSYNAKSQGKGVCTVDVCGDGSLVTGNYCGHGSCNIFGCRCDGGCRRGNPIKKFQDFYGDYHITDVHFV